MRILILDNYDSFTYNLKDYLEQFGAETICIRNDQLSVDQILDLKFDGIVLSPGPSTPADSGVLMELIERYPKHIPMLGVCLGFQALGLFFGANLTKLPVPVHGKVSPVLIQKHDMFADFGSETEVCRYHSLCLTDLPTTLTSTAHLANGLCMAFAHNQLPVWAYQFHPEAILTIDGKKMISLWLKHVEFLSV